MPTDPNGRTHEPSLRELTSELDGVKALLESKLEFISTLLEERDSRYKERFDTQEKHTDKLFEAKDKSVEVAFLNSKEAISKAEEAQASYNLSHNDLARRMDEQYKSMVPTKEAQLKWDAIDKETSELRKEFYILRDMLPKEINGLRSELMKEISSLRESRSEQGGGARVLEAAHSQHNWSVGIIVAIVLSLAASAISAVEILIRK